MEIFLNSKESELFINMCNKYYEEKYTLEETKLPAIIIDSINKYNKPYFIETMKNKLVDLFINLSGMVDCDFVIEGKGKDYILQRLGSYFIPCGEYRLWIDRNISNKSILDLIKLLDTIENVKDINKYFDYEIVSDCEDEYSGYIMAEMEFKIIFNYNNTKVNMFNIFNLKYITCLEEAW